MNTQNPKLLIQSYVFSRIRADVNRYEMRVILRLIETAQVYLNGEPIKRHLCKTECSEIEEIVEVPTVDLLPTGSHHYEYLYNALRNLCSKPIERFDPSENVWRVSPLLGMADVNKSTGTTKLYVRKWVWDAILDFTKGFVKFDFNVALSLKNPVACRLFFLVSGQKMPMRYPVEELKKMLGLNNPGYRTSELLSRVLTPAARELMESAPWYGELRPIREGRKIVQIMIYPYEQPEFYSRGVYEKTLASKSGSAFGNHALYQYMRYTLGFSNIELRRNKMLLETFSQIESDCVGLCAEMAHRARKSGTEKRKAYVIGAMKSHVVKVQSSERPAP